MLMTATYVYSNLFITVGFFKELCFANFERPVLGCIDAEFCKYYALELGSSLKKILRKKGTWMKKYVRD